MNELVRYSMCVVLAALCGAAGAGAESASPAQPAAAPVQEMYQTALFREVVLGEARAAIVGYEQVASRMGEDPVLAGLASIRVGECYEKLGDLNRAADVFWDVWNRFGAVASIRQVVEQKLLMRSRRLSADSWFVVTADAFRLVESLQFLPHQKGGAQDGVELRWQGSVPTGATAFGLRSGDVVTELNGIPLSSQDGILRAIEAMRHLPGNFELTVLRDNEKLALQYIVRNAAIMVPREREK